jgi:queuine/archaeosine tRNA-ribosyltransferase
MCYRRHFQHKEEHHHGLMDERSKVLSDKGGEAATSLAKKNQNQNETKVFRNR